MVRGGHLLAKAFHEKNIKYVFTLAGGFCNPALEGFKNCQIPVINCPHEQIAGHLADGHTRVTREPTICLVGPEGFANAVPAMMEAWGERSPVIFITGSSTLKRKGAGGFKEIDDVAMAAPITKYSCSVTDGTRIREFVDRAYKIAVSGYPGPVHLSIPVDIMFSSFPDDISKTERPFRQSLYPTPRAWPDPKALDKIIEIIKMSKRPILIAGHGVWWSKSEEKLASFAKTLGVPIFNIPYHQKLLGSNYKEMMGLADVHQYHPSKWAFNNCDCIIMVGGRLDNQMNFGNPPLFPKSLQLICVNGSDEEIQMNRAADHLLLSDPGAFFEELLKAKEILTGKFEPSWLEKHLQMRKTWVDETLSNLESKTSKKSWQGGVIHPLQLAMDVMETMEDGNHLVFDGGNTHFWSEIAANVIAQKGKNLSTIMHPGSFSLLGLGVSFAVSLKRIHPQDNVVLISGDGAFLSGGLSIELAFQEGLPIVVIVDNNGGLDCISQQQERMFQSGSHFATDFRDIPFHDMFKGLGGYGELVTNRADIKSAVKRAINSGKPACINVKTRGQISPIVAATSDKRDKSSIE
ncbi:MAG: thiamine pyrophosphate-binding protein [Paracoccaceae bacterium]|nr:thiamine pyrophosphate-binding protein [Paracoccaceae bacterium]